ncbi:MAG: hypothetical protein FWC53_01000 [Firmicutes bacterium]|nr:hypothetical protein [Bacillota bacterium]
MPRNKYEYETSPRKLRPEQIPKKKPKVNKQKINKTQKIEKNEKTVNRAAAKSERIKHVKTITYIIIGFIILFGISYRNSQIDQDFSKLQSLKQQAQGIQKKNDQLQLSIESSTNLGSLEQEAKDTLGMQKLNSGQTVYVTLPKTDYIEPAAEQVVIQDKQSIFTDIMNWFENIFK